MVVSYCVPLGSVPNWEAEEGSENRVSASEGSRDTLRFQRGEPMPPIPSSSLPRLLLDIVSEIRLWESSRRICRLVKGWFVTRGIWGVATKNIGGAEILLKG